MRRTCTAFIALTALLLAVGSTGPSALAISTGPLTANPDPVAFGTQDVGDATPAQTVTLTNASGTVALTISSIGASGDYNVPGGSDSCTGATLGIGDSCNVGVTLQPSSTGPDPGTLTINDDDSTDNNPQQTVDLSGQGVTNQFSASTLSSFPDQPVNTTSGAQSVTVTNNTDYAANPANPSITGSNAGDFNASGCNSTVAANSQCSVNVTFTPSATGTRNATLDVASQQVALSGNGVQANASVTPSSATFGSQPTNTTSNPTTITLTNTGSGTLTYSNTTVTGADPNDFSVGDGNCASAAFLAPNGGACTITVQFVPTATGHRSASIVVHDNAPSGTQTVTVSGTATASSVGFGPPTVTFAKTIPAGTGSPGHTITVFNETSANMPITSTVITGANPKSFIETGDLCSGKTLAPNGGKCTVKVRFTPSSAGRRTALLEINDTGPIAPHVHEVTLTGNATSPNNPKDVVGSVGCSTAHIRWVAPSATRFAGTIVVRNHVRYPTSAGDGTRVPHTSGVATDTGLKHFTTYYYRVFATYHSLTHPGKLNYSQGARMKERTGEICTPENGATIRTVTPKFTWLPAPTKGAYAFVLQRESDPIDANYATRTHLRLRSSWRWKKATHRLLSGHRYTFFLFAYTASHPSGHLIGETTFTVRR
jgi:hypothetical protein